MKTDRTLTSEYKKKEGTDELYQHVSWIYDEFSEMIISNREEVKKLKKTVLKLQIITYITILIFAVILILNNY